MYNTNYCDFLNDVDEVEIRRFFSLRKSENRKNNEIVSRCIITDWLGWLERQRVEEIEQRSYWEKSKLQFIPSYDPQSHKNNEK